MTDERLPTLPITELRVSGGKGREMNDIRISSSWQVRETYKGGNSQRGEGLDEHEHEYIT